MPKEFLLATGDGAQLASYLWEPQDGQDVKACLVIVHGIGEHSMRYDEYASYFASRGIAVFSMDLRGHGKSPGKRGHTAPRGRILEDIDYLCWHASKTYPDKPVFIYGHSLGGNVGLSHRLYGAFKPKAYVITSPWMILYNKPGTVSTLFLTMLGLVFPSMRIKSAIDPNVITSDKTQVELYHTDKLMHGFISLRTAMDCLSYARDITNRSGEEHGAFLLMHGTDDHLCSIEGSRKLMEKAASQCTYREWEGCRHELQHDLKRDEVKVVIADWVLAKIS